MICKICSEEVKDMWNHSSVDEKHKEIVDAFDYLGKEECCLCGGKIIRMGVGINGWNISCRKCGFLWDED